MKPLALFLFLLIATFAHAQQVRLTGKVVDSQTNQPIPAATIGILKKNLFYPADNLGKFDINLDELDISDTISFSCIGYQSLKLKAADMPLNLVVKLTPLVTLLQEVKIGFNPLDPIKVGSKVRIGFATASYMPSDEQAMFMEGSTGMKATIQSVGFYLSKGNILGGRQGDAKAPFRIRIYAVDSSGNPGTELTKDIIIVSAKRNNAWFDVNVSAYHIENPATGFFVAFCLLDESYYKMRNTYDNSSDATMTPRLDLTQHEFKQSRSFRGTSRYYGPHWEKDEFNYSYMIRAAIEPE